MDADAEQASFKRTGDRTGLLTLLVSAEGSEMLAEMLMAHKAVGSVEVLSPLYWPQQASARSSASKSS